MVVQVFNLSAWEAEVGGISEFKARLASHGYIVRPRLKNKQRYSLLNYFELQHSHKLASHQSVCADGTTPQSALRAKARQPQACRI